MCTSLSALPELKSPPCVRTLPACLPTISAPACQDSPEGGRRQEDRKCHPHFTDLESLREHATGCSICQMEKSHPKGGKSLVPGPGVQSHREERAPGCRCSCCTAAQNQARLLWASAWLSGHRVACLAGLRGEGWWTGALTKSSSQALGFTLASGHTAILPVPCLHSHVRFSGHDPYLWRFPGGAG